MGKRKAVKRFIDTNCVKVISNDNEIAPDHLEKVVEKKIDEAQPKEKKVSFQLRCDLPVEVEVQAVNQNPDSGERKDLRRYEIYYKDDYDYLKHLKARDEIIWEDEGMELGIAPKPDLQQKKKDRREEKKLKKRLNQAPGDSSLLNYVVEEIYADELDEEAASKLFSDADVVGDLPDNLVAILDGAASDDDEWPIFNEGGEDDIDIMAEGEVDYSKMPPLEQHDHASDEDWRSDISCDFMDVSDEEYEDDSDFELPTSLEKNDDNFPSLAAAKNITVKAPKKLQTAKDFITDSDEKRPAMVMSLKDFQEMPQEKLDRFFEGVAEASDEGGYKTTEAECPHSGVPSSKTAVKDITEKVDMLNEHFNAMLVREYKRSDVCGDGLEDVEGALDEDAPQFQAAVAADRSGRPLDGRVLLSGPFDGRETNADKELRNRALNFCKNWRETKEELVEVAIPDRHAMMYNATNLPVVRNKNFPALIKPDLPLYFNQKKKKGLTVKDIKLHDREMNAPTSNAEEDAQTFKTMLTELSYRPPDESSADRRDRKTAVRELRRGRREEKKLNQLAHKEMVLQTSKVLMHARHYRNTAVI